LGLLQVLDPQTGRVLSQAESQATLLDLSADGTRLFLSGWQGEEPERRLRLDVLDAATLAPLGSLEDWLLWSGRRLDRQPLLLGYNFERTDRVAAAAFDPQTLEAGVVFEGGVLEGGDPPPAPAPPTERRATRGVKLFEFGAAEGEADVLVQFPFPARI
jgi:hypothetical protein